MRRLRPLGLLITAAALLLSGCTNMPEVQAMAYITAIGIDYDDGKWIAYGQVLNFSNIARTEQLEIGKAVPVWVGRGEGETVSDALTNVGRTAQMQVFWGHVKTVIMSERALKHGVDEIYKAVNRYREVRYNVLVYGTKEDLKEILIQKSLLNLSPLDTLMISESQVSSPKAFILPVKGHRAIAKLNEPGNPGKLPSIGLDANDWREDRETKPMLILSGMYFFRDEKMIGWMSQDDLMGMRWAEDKLKETTLRVPADGEVGAILTLSEPQMSIKPIIRNGLVRYQISVNVEGFVLELVRDMTLAYLELEGEKMIREEIVETYLKAIKMKCDPYGLQQAYYRADPKGFRKAAALSPFLLDKDSLEAINVHIKLVNMGKYKGTARE